MPSGPDGMMEDVQLLRLDEVEGMAVDLGPIGGTSYDLGRAVGTTRVGLRRFVCAPGKHTTPAHVHSAEEEILYVRGGSALSWEDGETFAVAAGDALLHRADGEGHTLIAGEGGLDVLVFGTHPWGQEAAVGELELPAAPSPRPDRIVVVADVPADRTEHRGHRFAEREVGRALGSERSTLAEMTIEAGCEGYPPHCHSLDEELFVIVAGAGALLLDDEEIPVRAGHVFTRPPGTRVAHSFRAADDADLVYLVYGDLNPNDIAHYPRSGKISFRGVGVIGRVEPLEYWDGEP